jgi:hypothetical protein
MPKSLEVISPRTGSIPDGLDLVHSLIHHPDLKLSREWLLELKRLEVTKDQDQYWSFDFRNALLPPNQLFSNNSQLIAFPKLVGAAVLCVQEYLVRSKNSKSRTSRARSLLYEVLATIEFLWLRGITDLSWASEEDFTDVPRMLSQEKWFGLLSILERSKNIAPSVLAELLRRKLIGEALLPHTSDSWKLKNLLATNLFGVAAYLRKEDRPADIKVGCYSASATCGSLNNINFLYDIGSEYGLNFLPFSKPETVAIRYGRPDGRTENMPVDMAAAMLKESANWIYIYGPLVVDLLEEVAQEVVRCKNLTRKYMGRRLSEFFQVSKHRLAANEQLPFKIELLDFGRRSSPKGESLRAAVLCLMTGCFVAIASMNARRKDEIIHRKYGLRVGDLRVVDDNLELYVVSFYIEKTYRKRCDFYVNKLTADAIKIMERMEQAHRSIERAVPSIPLAALDAEPERALFSYRRYSIMKGVGIDRKWYDFTKYAHDNDAALFLRLALGKDKLVETRAHMFRRLYALVFFYQYENAELQALAQQLGHFSLSTTLTYVTDSRSVEEHKSIANILQNQRDVYAEHRKSIATELAGVGGDKFAHDVFSVLSGREELGGYSRYLRRIHSQFAKAVSFSKNTDASSSVSVLKAVKQRGHFPRPMPHGQCMAGNVLRPVSGKCYSSSDKRLHKEHASVERCSTCMFHLTSPAYLFNVESDLARQKERSGSAASGSLIAIALDTDIANLEQALKLARLRVGKNSNTRGQDGE